MVDSAHRSPGGNESLRALYEAVPSAEELDLAEDTTVDTAAYRVNDPTDEQSDEPDPADMAETADDEITPLTDGQARGVLEQLLGAEPVEDDPDES